MTTTTTETPRIYVACLASYNAGTLHGEWIDADQEADELHKAIRAMLRKSPHPNVIRRDWECHCGAEWTADVRSTPETPNISGEAAQYCPECGERAAFGSPAYPSAEEWAIHDSEGFGGWSPGEWESMDAVAAMAAGISEHGEGFAAFVDYSGLDPSEAADQFSDAYCGEWDSEREYAENLADDLEMLSQVPENLRYYFDYDKFARDLFMSDYRFSGGYVFCTHW